MYIRDLFQVITIVVLCTHLWNDHNPKTNMIIDKRTTQYSNMSIDDSTLPNSFKIHHWREGEDGKLTYEYYNTMNIMYNKKTKLLTVIFGNDKYELTGKWSTDSPKLLTLIEEWDKE